MNLSKLPFNPFTVLACGTSSNRDFHNFSGKQASPVSVLNIHLTSFIWYPLALSGVMNNWFLFTISIVLIISPYHLSLTSSSSAFFLVLAYFYGVHSVPLIVPVAFSWTFSSLIILIYKKGQRQTSSFSKTIWEKNSLYFLVFLCGKRATKWWLIWYVW